MIYDKIFFINTSDMTSGWTVGPIAITELQRSELQWHVLKRWTFIVNHDFQGITADNARIV